MADCICHRSRSFAAQTSCLYWAYSIPEEGLPVNRVLFSSYTRLCNSPGLLPDDAPDSCTPVKGYDNNSAVLISSLQEAIP